MPEERSKILRPFTRPCPGCGVTLRYKAKDGRDSCARRGTTCRTCFNRRTWVGRKHSEETRKKMSAADHSYTKTEKFAAAVRRGMVGKKSGWNMRLVWTEKYGKEGFVERLQALRDKHSKNNRGTRNPMFGKPAPTGSGNGWSGWYKGWYFRSLLELSYVVSVLEASGSSWRPAESLELRIPYVDPLGSARTYTADFLVDEKVLIECKPKRLVNTPLVRAKAEAAVRFCADRGLEYRIESVMVLPEEQIKHLRESGLVRFLPRYEKKYLERYGLAE